MEPYCDFYCVHCVHMFPLRWVNPQRIFAALLDGFRKTADLRDAFARRFFADRALPYSDGDTYWLWDVVRLCRGHCVQYSVRVCDYMVPEKHRRLQRCAACLLWTGHVPDYRYCGMLAECLRLARRDGIVWPCRRRTVFLRWFFIYPRPLLGNAIEGGKGYHSGVCRFCFAFAPGCLLINLAHDDYHDWLGDRGERDADDIGICRPRSFSKFDVWDYSSFCMHRSVEYRKTV